MVQDTIEKTMKWIPARVTPPEAIYCKGFTGPAFGVTLDDEDNIVVLMEGEDGEWHPTTRFPFQVVDEIEDLLVETTPEAIPIIAKWHPMRD